jgi:hypothetical protein
MSVGTHTKLHEALAVVRRKPVWGGLVLSDAGQCSAAPERCQSQHARGRDRCSDIGAAPLEPIDMGPNALPLSGRSAQSP